MERTTCPHCHTSLDDSLLISCPNCRTILSTYEQTQKIHQELLTTHKEALVNEIKKATLKNLVGWIFLGLSIIGALAGYGLLQIYWGLQTLVTNRIASQFEEPRISAILTEVAENRASKIIEDRLTPAINEAKETIKNLEEQLRQDVVNIRISFEKELAELRHQAEIQKQVREIQRLKFYTLATCDYSGINYNKLENYLQTENDLDVRSAVLAARSDIFHELVYKKFPWTLDLNIQLPDGSTVPMHTLDADGLINALKHKIYLHRGAAVSLLGERRQCNIPEALLETINSDESLCVRVEAMRTYNKISGINYPYYPFDSATRVLQSLYDRDRDQIRKRLNCNDEEQ